MEISYKLDNFEGPLDLLLHLIEKNKVSIYDIPIVLITEQYLEYVNQMDHEDLDVVSDFLVMAATLLDIKSRMLLPKVEKEEEEDEDDEKASEELRSRKKAALEEKKKREEQEMTEQLRAADQKTAEEEKQDEFEIPDLEEEGTEQVSFHTVDLQNLVRGEETEEIPEAVEETEIVEEAAAEETAEEVTEETESAEPETVEEIEEFEETIEEPEEEPEPEPSEPIELAMPVYTAEELLQKAHAAGDDPKVIEDPATGITILDYSDIL